MRTIYVESDRTATLDELRNGNIIALAAGVDLVLPSPSSRFTAFTVKALGASCTIQSDAGIENTSHAVVTTAIALTDGDAMQFFSYQDVAAGTQSAYRLGAVG